MYYTCPKCGVRVYIYDQDRHNQKFCAPFRRGIILPPTVAPDLHDGIPRVEYTHLNPLVRLAVRLGKLARLSGHYPTMPDPTLPGGVEDCQKFKTVIYVPVVGQRAVGYFLVQQASAWHEAVFTDGEHFTSMKGSLQKCPRPTIGLVFVCRDYRRRSLAAQVLNQIAHDYGCGPGGFAWSEPFSPEGFALVTGWVGSTTLALAVG